jgi:Prokaryotic N-terminal methylation motif
MRTLPCARRAGATLLEVVVALFILALGLLALLTLFPLGALNMAQAIKDQRTADAAANADAVARALWKYAVEKNGGTDPEPAVDRAFASPCQNLPPLPAALPQPDWLPDRSAAGPSYPVFVDIWGSSPYPGNASVPMTPNNWRLWLAGQQNGVPRRTLAAPGAALKPPAGDNPFSPSSLSLSLFASPDALVFAEDGTPGSLVERDYRYSWAYLVRRGVPSQPRLLDVTVVVYSGRSLRLTQDLVPAGEAVFPANFVRGSNVARLQYTGERPGIRPGGWVMDALMYDAGYPDEPPRGYFYRVASVTDIDANTIELELGTPAKEGHPDQTGPALVLEQVVEVFERPTMGP